MDLEIEEKYTKLELKEHILKRPDSYIGSIEEECKKLWVYDEESNKLVLREIRYVPGLYKIFDEVLVNAADHYQNNPSKVKNIKVIIDKVTNIISVENDGPGIDVIIHKKEKIYIPELIFGNLLTSTNYNDNEERVTGGRNGYGAKLANIFSKEFIIETIDSERQKYYKQIYRNNMSIKESPEIKNTKDKSYTRITFLPDFEKFNMTRITDDNYSLLVKRVYDIAGVTPNNLNVYINNRKIQLEDFKSYVKLYVDSLKSNEIHESSESNSDSEESDDSISSKEIQKKEKEEILFFKPNDRWEVAVVVTISNFQFQHVSFVNSICTLKGGTHVNYFVDKLITTVKTHIEKSKKGKDLDIKSSLIKNHLWVFINCKIINPNFDSQTKENMTLKVANFGSEFELDDKFIKKFLKSGIIDYSLKFAKANDDLKLMKNLNNGIKKSGRVHGIPKLEDANFAGGKRSDICTLILTEGDSAKSLAVAGFEVVGRDQFGVFPLKGKLLNVRDASTLKIINNEEIQNIMKILGLQIGVDYSDLSKLRYGSLMIMTDQDHDGSHIKGLIINFIHKFWPSLFKLNGFLQQFITPIIKMTKGNRTESFYTMTHYKDFINKELNGETKGWKIKYYKGLGTSTDKEAKEYFSNLEKNKIEFEYEDINDENAIDLAFSKEKVNDRKDWLSKFDPINDVIEFDDDKIRYKDFVNKELIHFSNSDNYRSIPSLCDGLKPSERKVLFSCFKRNLKDEIKVAQLSGYISEHSAYHHGEVSLQSTIVAMSQNFVGSNNINLLMPLGQFGTRNAGGEDHASSRYIYTNLSKITRHIFNKDDDDILEYQYEENYRIEPKWYIPIIPLILINGTQGIGTGWSTNISCYNPKEIVNILKDKILSDKEFPNNIIPFYKGFTGEINEEKDGDFIIKGKFFWKDDLLIINELPVKFWTKNYKEFLEKLMGIENKESKDKKKKKKKDKEKEKEKEKKGKSLKSPIIEDFTEHHTNNRVEFRIKLHMEFYEKYKNDNELVYKDFKLISSKRNTNMVLFNSEGKIRKYLQIKQILEEFFKIRKLFYSKRKEHLLNILEKELLLVSNKVRFILMIVNEELNVNNKKKDELVKKLIELKFSTITEINNILKIKNEIDNDKNNNDINQEEKEITSSSNEFNYLLSMQIWNLTHEKVEQLKKEKNQKKIEYEVLKNTTIETLWMRDLDNFVKILDEIEKEEEEERLKEIKKDNKKGKVKTKGKKIKIKDENTSELNSTDNSVINNFMIPLGERLKVDNKKRKINNN